jgi:hypothetical protein
LTIRAEAQTVAHQGIVARALLAVHDDEHLRAHGSTVGQASTVGAERQALSHNGSVGGMFGVVDDDTHTGVRHRDVGNALAIRAKAQGTSSAKRRIGFGRFAIHDEKALTVLLGAVCQAFAVRAKA